MKIRVQGRSVKFVDSELSKNEERQADLGDPQTEREPVRDDWSADNREPASHADVCSWTAPQFDAWLATGRRPRTADEAEPNSRQKQIEQAEHFARVSDARWGYRGGLTTDEMRGLSPSEKYAAASAKMRASHDPFGRMADLRRRRSE
jgi:hypothetical protein